MLIYEREVLALHGAWELLARDYAIEQASKFMFIKFSQDLLSPEMGSALRI